MTAKQTSALIIVDGRATPPRSVAPTLLRLMRLEQPAEMTGKPLFTVD